MHYLCVIEIPVFTTTNLTRILHTPCGLLFLRVRRPQFIACHREATAIHRVSSSGDCSVSSSGDRNSSRFVELRLQFIACHRVAIAAFHLVATAIHRVSSSCDRNSSHFIELRPQSSRFIELPAQLRPQFIAFQRVRRPQSSHFIEVRPQFIAFRPPMAAGVRVASERSTQQSLPIDTGY